MLFYEFFSATDAHGFSKHDGRIASLTPIVCDSFPLLCQQSSVELIHTTQKYYTRLKKDSRFATTSVFLVIN